MSSSRVATAAPPAPSTGTRPKVVRGGTASLAGAGVLIASVLVLALWVPYNVSLGTMSDLVGLFVLVILGTTWNLMAGYGGLVSIGQQAYIGVGAYGLIVLADKVGMSPYVAVPLAALACGVVGFLASEKSGYMTGEAVNVSGGLVMH